MNRVVGKNGNRVVGTWKEGLGEYGLSGRGDAGERLEPRKDTTTPGLPRLAKLASLATELFLRRAIYVWRATAHPHATTYESNATDYSTSFAAMQC